MCEWDTDPCVRLDNATNNTPPRVFVVPVFSGAALLYPQDDMYIFLGTEKTRPGILIKMFQVKLQAYTPPC